MVKFTILLPRKILTFLSDQWLSNFQVFFPSWKFFIQPGFQAKLSICDQSGEWHSCGWPVKPQTRNLFFNPSGNLAHAYDSLLSQFVLELNEKEDVLNSTYFAFVKNLVLMTAHEKKLQIHAFKIEMVDPLTQERIEVFRTEMV